MSQTAIFGGTFNPFHIGHYEMLTALQNDDSISEILLMPDKIPPHKECDFLASDFDRIKMCEIVAADFSKVKLCLIEFEREGKSYTYDTVKLLKQKFKEKDFVFVCGGDMLVYFDKWYKFKDLMQELPFIVFKRNDTDENEFDECVKRFSNMGMKIKIMPDVITAISSTKIRENFNNLEKLIPKNVLSYIMEKGVYGE